MGLLDGMDCQSWIVLAGGLDSAYVWSHSRSSGLSAVLGLDGAYSLHLSAHHLSHQTGEDGSSGEILCDVTPNRLLGAGPAGSGKAGTFGKNGDRIQIKIQEARGKSKCEMRKKRNCELRIANWKRRQTADHRPQLILPSAVRGRYSELESVRALELENVRAKEL